MIEIVAATRLSESDFWQRSPLGRSLKRINQDSRLVPAISFDNQRGLPEIYNSRISAPKGSELLVFVHDDVWIDDFFLVERVIGGLEAFDIIGVAGNRRRLPSQPGWSIIDSKLSWEDRSNVSGAIAHGSGPFGAVSFYGAVPVQCKILDGVFLATKKSTLIQYSIRFDTRFSFHFYDLDFCRSARNSGLRLGTWPVCLTHCSKGGFGSREWHEGYREYLEKWGS